MLKETLEMVIERMKKYRDLYEKSEESVRYHIINPILKELGWGETSPLVFLFSSDVFDFWKEEVVQKFDPEGFGYKTVSAETFCLPYVLVAVVATEHQNRKIGTFLFYSLEEGKTLLVP